MQPFRPPSPSRAYNSNYRHAAPGRTRLPAATRRGSPAALLRDEQLYVGAGRRSLCSSATNRSRFLAGGGAAPGFTLAETLGDGATPTAFGQSVPTHGRSVTATRCLRIARGSFSFPARLDLEREIGSLDSSGWFLSGLKTDGQPGGGMLCPRAFAPGLRSTRLPLESEPLLRSVSYMKA